MIDLEPERCRFAGWCCCGRRRGWRWLERRLVRWPVGWPNGSAFVAGAGVFDGDALGSVVVSGSYAAWRTSGGLLADSVSLPERVTAGEGDRVGARGIRRPGGLPRREAPEADTDAFVAGGGVIHPPRPQGVGPQGCGPGRRRRWTSCPRRTRGVRCDRPRVDGAGPRWRPAAARSLRPGHGRAHPPACATAGRAGTALPRTSWPPSRRRKRHRVDVMRFPGAAGALSCVTHVPVRAPRARTCGPGTTPPPGPLRRSAAPFPDRATGRSCFAGRTCPGKPSVAAGASYRTAGQAARPVLESWGLDEDRVYDTLLVIPTD